MKLRRLCFLLLGATVSCVGLYLAVVYAEVRSLRSPRNGPETPATLGIRFERVVIPSHGRRLEGYVVHARKEPHAEHAVLIFHGAGESISDWVLPQKLLRDGGISSLVFDYSGNGDSSGTASGRNLNEDARAAYAVFLSQFPEAQSRALMGFSMGNAPLLDALPELIPPPSRIVLAAAFSSIRDLVHYTFGVPAILCALLPDQWNNVRAARYVRVPALVLHSQDDRSDPIWMGAAIFRAIPDHKQMVTLHGFQHRDGYLQQDWWAPIISFLAQ
jgi:uncharacterized protein